MQLIDTFVFSGFLFPYRLILTEYYCVCVVQEITSCWVCWLDTESKNPGYYMPIIIWLCLIYVLWLWELKMVVMLEMKCHNCFKLFWRIVCSNVFHRFRWNRRPVFCCRKTADCRTRTTNLLSKNRTVPTHSPNRVYTYLKSYTLTHTRHPKLYIYLYTKYCSWFSIYHRIGMMMAQRKPSVCLDDCNILYLRTQINTHTYKPH